jgi:hypothetical protein
VVAPVALAAVLAVGYGLWAPHSADLAAQLARAELFRRSGETPYWTGWYAGVPTVGYSLLTPPLLGALGPVLLGSLSVLGTGVVVVPLLRGARRPALGGCGFVVAAALDVTSGRTTFAVGALLALVAVLAADRRRRVPALLLAALATAASPVAGILLLVVAAALLLADRDRRAAATAMATGTLLALAALVVLNRGAGGGMEPFSVSSLLMALGTTLVVVLAPGSRRARAGSVVGLLALLVVFAVPSPIGANITRLAVLTAAPTLLATARLRAVPLTVTVVVAALLPFAQLRNDLAMVRRQDPPQSFVAGVRDRLAADPLARTHRVEVVDTATHWPSTYLLPTVTLARGWERQTDEARNPEFYGRAPLTAQSYRRFLDANAVGLVAVPRGTLLDYGSTREAALVGRGLPYLRLSWTGPHWRLYTVADPTPLVQAPGRVLRQTADGLLLATPAAGSYPVRLRWSPYLVVDGGTVRRSPVGQTVVTVSRAGVHLLHVSWRWP